MPRPRYCPNPACAHFSGGHSDWLIRNGSYHTLAHRRVQRYRCRGCGRGLSDQTESVHYYAKRRLDLRRVFTRLRGGSSMRDIARECSCSANAISAAVLRLGRQSMAAHLAVITPSVRSAHMCFDGLVSALGSRDYPSQITTLGDSESELLLSMSHCVTERGGTRTPAQRSRIARHRQRWTPPKGALSESISLIISELSRFIGPTSLVLDTDEHPLYRTLLTQDLAVRWYRTHRLLELRTTSGSAPRTTSNPLFLMNYFDRMIRHRLKEHTRESIALARNATMQMHRMWLFAFDHNFCQPRRVKVCRDASRVEHAGLGGRALSRIRREFFTRRISLRGLALPGSISQVWRASLATPPVRWHTAQKRSGPEIPAFALRDLACASPHGP